MGLLYSQEMVPLEEYFPLNHRCHHFQESIPVFPLQCFLPNILALYYFVHHSSSLAQIPSLDKDPSYDELDQAFGDEVIFPPQYLYL